MNSILLGRFSICFSPKLQDTWGPPRPPTPPPLGPRPGHGAGHKVATQAHLFAGQEALQRAVHRHAEDVQEPWGKSRDARDPWIGLRENLNRKPWFLPSKIGLSCKFSHHPIL